MRIHSNPQVTDYIAQFPPDVRERLAVLRKVIHRTFPTAIEDISYKMPAYRLYHGKQAVVFLGGFKNHIGIFAVLTPDESRLYKRIAPYNTGRGTLQFKNDEQLPLLLIEEVLAHHYIKLMGI